MGDELSARVISQMRERVEEKSTARRPSQAPIREDSPPVIEGVLRFIGFIYIVVAGVAVVFAFRPETSTGMMIGTACAAGVVGILFVALARVLVLLRRIEKALRRD